MIVIIAGTRTFQSYEEVCKAITESGFEITEVISGGAHGVDSFGEEWANKNSVPFKRFKPDWDLHGLSAGPIRNQAMVNLAEGLILIWDGKSRGSKDVKAKAMAKGLKIFEKIICE